MALTGTDISARYKDVVQLEQGGDGYPSGANECALYDGSGAQILGRTAVRHWLDPHPDAASFDETWEFSTTGDMTQGELETAGWTFENCTAAVTSGILWLTASSAALTRAYLTVSLAGDFDFWIGPVSPMGYGDTVSMATANPYMSVGGGGVAYTTGDEYAYHAYTYRQLGGLAKTIKLRQGTWTSLAGTAAYSTDYNNFGVRISRVSSTVYVRSAADYPVFRSDDTTSDAVGFNEQTTSAGEASTFTRLFLSPTYNATVIDGSKSGFYFIRRFQ